ncbi:MAG: hypothetical protein Q8Q95_02615 [bacterium]|nr:hypothetical protein [bacterium]
MKDSRKNLILVLIIFTLGTVVGWFLSYFFNRNIETKDPSINKIHPVSVDYKFINPLLGFDISDNQEEFGNLKPLRDELNKLIDN